FLAAFISLSDESLFKKLTNKKSKIDNPKLEEEQWRDAFTNKLINFSPEWEEKQYEMSWETLSVNLCSLFYQLIFLPKVSAQVNEIQSEVNKLVKLFEELPDHHKIYFYNKSMK